MGNSPPSLPGSVKESDTERVQFSRLSINTNTNNTIYDQDNSENQRDNENLNDFQDSEESLQFRHHFHGILRKINDNDSRRLSLNADEAAALKTVFYMIQNEQQNGDNGNDDAETYIEQDVLSKLMDDDKNTPQYISFFKDHYAKPSSSSSSNSSSSSSDINNGNNNTNEQYPYGDSRTSKRRSSKIFADEVLNLDNLTFSGEIKKLKEMVNFKDWNFNIWNLENATPYPLVVVGETALEQLELIDYFHLNSNRLRNFFKVIQENYNNVPYHNLYHAADVTQSAFCLGTTGNLFHILQTSNLQKLGIIIAAAIHDVGHFGVTGKFLVSTLHDLAIQYNDISPLENMHLAKAFKIWLDPKNNFTTGFSSTSFHELRKFIIELVLATDNDQHFELTEKLTQVVTSVTGGNTSSSSSSSVMAGRRDMRSSTSIFETQPDSNRSGVLTKALSQTDLTKADSQTPNNTIDNTNNISNKTFKASDSTHNRPAYMNFTPSNSNNNNNNTTNMNTSTSNSLGLSPINSGKNRLYNSSPPQHTFSHLPMSATSNMVPTSHLSMSATSNMFPTPQPTPNSITKMKRQTTDEVGTRQSRRTTFPGFTMSPSASVSLSLSPIPMDADNNNSSRRSSGNNSLPPFTTTVIDKSPRHLQHNSNNHNMRQLSISQESLLSVASSASSTTSQNNNNTSFQNNNNLNNNSNYSANSPVPITFTPLQVQTVLKCLLHSADVCSSAKPWAIYSLWSPRILQEFYAEGDRQREMQLPITFAFDRYNPQPEHKFQSGFVRIIVSPLYTALSRLPGANLQTCVENIKDNITHWETLGEEQAVAAAMTELANINSARSNSSSSSSSSEGIRRSNNDGSTSSSADVNGNNHHNGDIGIYGNNNNNSNNNSSVSNHQNGSHQLLNSSPLSSSFSVVKNSDGTKDKNNSDNYNMLDTSIIHNGEVNDHKDILLLPLNIKLPPSLYSDTNTLPVTTTRGGGGMESNQSTSRTADTVSSSGEASTRVVKWSKDSKDDNYDDDDDEDDDTIIANEKTIHDDIDGIMTATTTSKNNTTSHDQNNTIPVPLASTAIMSDKKMLLSALSPTSSFLWPKVDTTEEKAVVVAEVADEKR